MTSVLAALDAVGAHLPGWVVTMTLWSGAIFVGLWALDRALEKRVAPAWRVVLYAAVFARVVIPTAWSSPVGLVGLELPGAGEANAVASTAASALVAPQAPALLGLPGPAAASSALDMARLELSWTQLALLIYAAGALGLLSWMYAARRRVRAELASARPARRSVAAMAPRHRILEHDDLGPLAFGLVDPVIVLPRTLVDELRDEELRCVVAHERAHLERRDPWLAWSLSVSTALAWPLLPVWFAAARMRQLIELAADARALAENAPRVYGQTLIKLAERGISTAPALPLAAGLHLGRFTDLKSRVASVHARPTLPSTLQALTVVGLGGLALACSAVATTGSDADTIAARCEALKKDATVLHDEAEKTRDEKVALDSLALYDEYADGCEQDPDYGQVVYYGGELLWARATAAYEAGDRAGAQALFAEAHGAFRHALAADPGKFEKDAAYAQLLSKRNELGEAYAPPADGEHGDPKVDAVETDAEFRPTEYDDAEAQMLEAFITYRAHVLDDADAEFQQTLYEQARLAMKHNRFDEAEPLLRRLHASPGERDLHIWGAEMLTDLLTIRWVDESNSPAAQVEATQVLEAWLDELDRSPRLKHDDAAALRQASQTLRAGIQWKHGMAARTAGDFDVCADAFEALAATHPAHAQRDALLFNAASCRIEAGQRAAGERLIRQLEAEHPNSPLVPQARELAAP